MIGGIKFYGWIVITLYKTMDSCNIYISYFSFPENSLYSIRKHLFEQEENFPLCGSTTISSGNMNFLFFCLLLVAFFGSLVGSFRIDVHIDDDKYLLEVDGGVDFEQAAMEFCRTKGLLDVSEVSTKNGCVAAIVCRQPSSFLRLRSSI